MSDSMKAKCERLQRYLDAEIVKSKNANLRKDELERENARYRNALEWIYGDCNKTALQLRDIAARALEDE